MIASIKEFFGQFIEPGTRSAGAGSERALQIATAALLMEMMRMDNQISDAERIAVAGTLQQQFGLAAEQIETLMSLAAEEARQASGYHQFTSLINQRCSAEQKLRIVENLWHVAMADGHLDAHESHLMNKIANLLHIGHADFVAAKQRARETAKLPLG